MQLGQRQPVNDGYHSDVKTSQHSSIVCSDLANDRSVGPFPSTSEIITILRIKLFIVA